MKQMKISAVGAAWVSSRVIINWPPCRYINNSTVDFASQLKFISKLLDGSVCRTDVPRYSKYLRLGKSVVIVHSTSWCKLMINDFIDTVYLCKNCFTPHGTILHALAIQKNNNLKCPQVQWSVLHSITITLRYLFANVHTRSFITVCKIKVLKVHLRMW